MKMSHVDLAGTRGALLALLIVVVIAAVAVAESATYRDAMLASLDNARRVHGVAQNRLIQSGEERELILRYRAAYSLLSERGLIGHEDRVGWIQALNHAARDQKLFGVDYALEAQRAGLRTVNTPAPVAFRESPMRLSIALLHEDDLMRFLDELSDTAPGLFDVRDCTLARLPRESAAPSNEPRLAANCTLAWITIAPASSSR